MKRILPDMSPIRIWELLNIEIALTLVVLLFVAPHVRGLPPAVTTNPAAGVTDVQAILHGDLTTVGDGVTETAFSLRQHAEKDCATLTCTITFDAVSLPGDTLILSGQSDTAGQEYCAAPTDNGGNTWSQFFGRLDGSSRGGMSWITNANPVTSITVTRCMGDHLRSLNVFDYPPSTVFQPGPYDDPGNLNSMGDGYGIELSSVHTETVAVVVTFTVNLGTNCVTNTAKQGTYLAKIQTPGIAGNLCSHSMHNPGGRANSVTNPDSQLLSTVALDLQKPYSAQVGFIWGKSPSLAGATNVTVNVLFAPATFLKSLSGLDRDTKYYFQAWANSSKGFVAGAILSFTTGGKILVDAWNGVIILVFVTLMVLFLMFMFWIRKKRGKGGIFGE